MSVYTIFVNQHLHCLVPNITWYQEWTNQVKIHSRSWVSRRIRNLVIWKTCYKDQEKWSLPNAPNLAVTWKKWKQKMEFYLTALMRGKRGEEKCSVFLFSTGEQGRDVFNTKTWEKKRNAEGNPRHEDDITVRQFFKNFEDCCLPKKNLAVERRKFFWKNQNDDETFDQYMTELKN